MQAWRHILTVFLIMPRLLHASDTDPFSTLVPGRNSSEKATERITFHPTLSASPHPEEALSAMLGVTLNRQGGPLAPSQIKLRGLSGARTSIALDGLDLSDPLSGLFDANDIPFFALSAVQNEGILSDSLGGDIRLSLPPPGKYFLNALAGVGSLGHARTQITAQAPLSSSVDALAGALLGTSRGDFEFLIPDSDPQRFEVRKNNDQHRLLTLTRLSLRTAKAHWSGTFFARIHEGGVAGFALNPTPNLRARHSFGGGVATAKFGLGRGAITSQLQTSFDARDTQDDSQQTRFEVHSLMHRFNIESMHPLQSFASELALGFGAEHRQILSTDFSRPGGEVFARFQNDWNGKWKPRLQVQILGRLYSGLPVLFGGNLQFSMEPAPFLELQLQLSRNSRPPTLSELYAPHGVVLGNPTLKPETSQDAEFRMRLAGEIWSTQINVFGGFLEEAILYVNRNAFEIAPVNTGRIVRAGVEVAAFVEAHRYLAFEYGAKWLHSRIIATAAAIPGTPPFFTHGTVRFGSDERFSAIVRARYQSDTSSNLFGELIAPAYPMVDISLRVVLYRGIAANLAFTNLLDIRFARDQHQMPLPGREVFFSLEMRS